MAFLGSGSRVGGARGPAFGFRFFCYAVLSVILMFYDKKGGWLDTARYGLQAAIYPLQLAVNSPSAAWSWVRESFATREALQKEVDGLRAQLREQQLITMRQAALASENATLRALNHSFPDVIEKRLVGEIINAETSTFRQRLLVNRGGQSTVYKSQPVVTGEGVLGQVFRIGPFSSEVILITDSEHMVPVQVVRSGVRTIALGTGDSNSLDLPYVPQNYDVKEGDLLVTSGLGRVFPFGLPVAKVTKVTRDPTQSLAAIQAAPLARMDSGREVLFIWSRPNHPAAPATSEALNIPVTKPAPKPVPKPARKPAPVATPAATPAPTQPAETTAPAPAAPAPAAPATPAPETATPTQPAPAETPGDDGPEAPPPQPDTGGTR
jgi:rod shape-determining protein MreC